MWNLCEIGFVVNLIAIRLNLKLTTMEEVYYPIGEQNFEKIITGGWLYVDKTGFLKYFLRGGYFFLGRPRRFGKSLFLSTLRYFFEGRRDLFRGLAADSLKWDWAPHPVFYLDLNAWGYYESNAIDQALDTHLKEWEEKYNVNVDCFEDFSTRLRNVIRKAFETTGKRVVILVDEYDKPLVNTLDDKNRFEANRNKLATFYSGFKSCAEFIHLLFLTGVSRFGKVSIFSGLNNIQDISVLKQYNAICGISESELDNNFRVGLHKYAENWGWNVDQVKSVLKKWYDGYHFSEGAEDIYNPFSLLLALDRCRTENFWIDSGGKPTVLIEPLKKYGIDLNVFFNVKCTREELTGIEIDSSQPIALFYQSGYLTIKGYDPFADLYTLGIPNGEVKRGFLQYLFPVYTSLKKQDVAFNVYQFVLEFESGNVEGFMKRLTSLFASVPYEMEMHSERNVHNALLMLMILVGLNVQTEYRTSDGRIDLFVKTQKYYYIIELKLDGTAEEALDQIRRKNYALPFASDGRGIIAIGASFSKQTRTIDSWKSSLLN